MQVLLGQILDKMQKDQKAKLPFLKSWELKRYCACSLHAAPPRRWAATQAIPLAQPLGPPHPHPFNQLTTPSQGASKGICCLFSLLTAVA